MSFDPQKVKHFFNSLNPKTVDEFNRRDQEKSARQAEAFIAAYAEEKCYVCNKPFKTMSQEEPCLHWLLRRCKFKKKDFPKIYQKYGYLHIAAFLRWCANQERLLSNINDLKDDSDPNMVISCTIKWKNIEWAFSCSESDLSGHPTMRINFPHYHFQMRIDGKRFISFGDYHIPFQKKDIIVLSLSNEPWFISNFGTIGFGMQDAMDIPHEYILEHSTVPENKENATYRLLTVVDASDNPISDKDIENIQKESKRTGKSMAHTAKKYFNGRVPMGTMIAPVDTIPDIAKRTGRRKKPS